MILGIGRGEGGTRFSPDERTIQGRSQPGPKLYFRTGIHSKEQQCPLIGAQ
jgi:hypothetical protein